MRLARRFLTLVFLFTLPLSLACDEDKDDSGDTGKNTSGSSESNSGGSGETGNGEAGESECSQPSDCDNIVCECPSGPVNYQGCNNGTCEGQEACAAVCESDGGESGGTQGGW